MNILGSISFHDCNTKSHSNNDKQGLHKIPHLQKVDAVSLYIGVQCHAYTKQGVAELEYPHTKFAFR